MMNRSIFHKSRRNVFQNTEIKILEQNANSDHFWKTLKHSTIRWMRPTMQLQKCYCGCKKSLHILGAIMHLDYPISDKELQRQSKS